MIGIIDGNNPNYIHDSEMEKSESYDFTCFLDVCKGVRHINRSGPNHTRVSGPWSTVKECNIMQKVYTIRGSTMPVALYVALGSASTPVFQMLLRKTPWSPTIRTNRKQLQVHTDG